MSELLKEPEGLEISPEEPEGEARLRSSLFEATKTIENPATIKPGDTVVIRFVGESDNETIRVVERRGTDHIQGSPLEVSLGTPLGMKIVGAKIDDVITYTISGNQTESITVIEINPSMTKEP